MLQQRVLALEDVVFCAMVGDGVFGADDLTAQHLGEADEVGVATGHDGITLRDALLLRNVMSAFVFDQMLLLETYVVVRETLQENTREKVRENIRHVAGLALERALDRRADGEA